MKAIHLKLPATSANLGPGFDTLGLALDLFLEIGAEPASNFSIEASGRNANICGSLDKNLLIETYCNILAQERRPVVPLAFRVKNQIPLGMGCGSSAAVRLAAVAVASHFGNLNWSRQRLVEVAAGIEGHPDNIAACLFGGLTVVSDESGRLATATIQPPDTWKAILALPEKPVSTAKSRSVLPAEYGQSQVVRNLQHVALMVAAFTSGREDLVVLASRDFLHQPYRMELCPLLPVLLPLAGENGILSVTLSGAGPAVLLLHSESASSVKEQIRERLDRASIAVKSVELLDASLLAAGAAIWEPEFGLK